VFICVDSYWFWFEYVLCLKTSHFKTVCKDDSGYITQLKQQKWTRRPASADRTARRQFQATGQPVSRTQASDALTSRLSRYEAKCVQRRCFQCGSVALRSDIKGTELPPANILIGHLEQISGGRGRPPANILIPLERQLIALQLCRWELLYNETLQQTFSPLLSKSFKKRQI